MENKPEKIESEKSKEELALERKKRKEEKADAKLKNKEKKETLQKEIKEPSKDVVKKKKEVNIYKSDARLNRLNKNKPIYYDSNRKNILITSALPYVNNEPHLGNIIGCVLSADVYARYSRLTGNNTIYVCGTDEYGTASETKALQEGCTPKELCDKYYKLHSEIYEWFNIDFDIFGRTSTESHTKITHDIFSKLMQNNNIVKEKTEQYKCMKCNMFLADKYVFGTCKNCGYELAEGDQCSKCGHLMVAVDLIDPKCKLCESKPEIKQTYHYFIDLPKIEPKLKEWMEVAKEDWSKNSVHISEGFLKNGLKTRCITRDLKWGVPVPTDDPDLENKVFYVWFDAPIGYISITSLLVDDKWVEWWKNPDNVTLYQFMGKDNVTFHSIIFPSSLLGTGDNYTKVNYLSTTEYLTYEGDKFSKTRGIGVFGSHVFETGIPCENWRYYLISIRPESGDTDFIWENFAEKNNKELNNNLGNLFHRVFSFTNSKFSGDFEAIRNYDKKLLFSDIDNDFIGLIHEEFRRYIELMNKVKLKEGLETAMKISSEANTYLQNVAPWDSFKSNVERCKLTLYIAFAAVRLIACILEPFIPTFSAKVYEIMNLKYDEYASIQIQNYLKSDFKECFFNGIQNLNKINTCDPIIGESK